jgi:uncharacterized membrane protein YgdD (TMEM256/DUF423 family)
MWQVFLYALLTAVATGLGALPFCCATKLTKERRAKANAIAAALMLAASFGLIYEGVHYSIPILDNNFLWVGWSTWLVVLGILL